jgi:hypothetical protein
MGLPPPGHNIPLQLRVTPVGDTEEWLRQFGAITIRTVQWQDRERLVEKAGPLAFRFQITGNETGMIFRSERCCCLGIPLPQAMAPSVEARVTGFETSWNVEVTISQPLLGLVTTYSGVVHPLS